MRSAPPMAPGIPRRNASPAIAASRAARATFTSGTAAPARIRAPGSAATLPNPRPSRITTPGTPPSRTMRLEPRPTTVTGTSAGRCVRKHDKSCSSSGTNRSCAGPPTRNHVNSASGWLGTSRPRNCDICALRAGKISGKVIHLSTYKVCASSPTRRSTDTSRRRAERRQFARQGVSPLRNVACPEADHVVARACNVLYQTRKLLGAVEPQHMAMPPRPDAGHEAVTVRARDGGFAGRIDGGHDHAVGIVEAGAEQLEQRLEAGVAMGLHHGDYLAGGGFARGAEHRFDLDRMVTVVVDHRNAVPAAGAGEAAPDSAEAGQRLADHRIGDAKIVCNR